MGAWRVWHSAKSFCDFVVDNTKLAEFKDEIEFKTLAESDASKSGVFHKVPDHIKKILYLDAPDVIVEYNSEPIICIEETKEAGTGHNGLQRFARIAAAAENNVPALYLMPEAVIIERKDSPMRWDSINPMVFKAFDSVMDIFKIPALFFYYPSDYREYADCPETSPNRKSKGIRYHEDIVKYSGCPTLDDNQVRSFINVVNAIIEHTLRHQPISTLIGHRSIKDQRCWMQREFYKKLGDREINKLSPLTATKKIPTRKLLNYLSKYAAYDAEYVSELLASRQETVIYQCNSKFRGDPYAGTLAAIDYIMCRCDKTYENRDANLVLCFGKVTEEAETITVDSKSCNVNDFIKTVNNSRSKNLLTARSFADIKPSEIGRYYMQVRYGSTYSKVKHIRVFSYFADAIIFADGALWREA